MSDYGWQDAPGPSYEDPMYVESSERRHKHRHKHRRSHHRESRDDLEGYAEGYAEGYTEDMEVGFDSSMEGERHRKHRKRSKHRHRSREGRRGHTGAILKDDRDDDPPMLLEDGEMLDEPPGNLEEGEVHQKSGPLLLEDGELMDEMETEYEAERHHRRREKRHRHRDRTAEKMQERLRELELLERERQLLTELEALREKERERERLKELMRREHEMRILEKRERERRELEAQEREIREREIRERELEREKRKKMDWWERELERQKERQMKERGETPVKEKRPEKDRDRKSIDEWGSGASRDPEGKSRGDSVKKGRTGAVLLEDRDFGRGGAVLMEDRDVGRSGTILREDRKEVGRTGAMLMEDRELGRTGAVLIEDSSPVGSDGYRRNRPGPSPRGDVRHGRTGAMLLEDRESPGGFAGRGRSGAVLLEDCDMPPPGMGPPGMMGYRGGMGRGQMWGRGRGGQYNRPYGRRDGNFDWQQQQGGGMKRPWDPNLQGPGPGREERDSRAKKKWQPKEEDLRLQNCVRSGTPPVEGVDDENQPPAWVRCSAADLYFTRDRKNGNMVTTQRMRDLEDKFDLELVQRAVKVKVTQKPYKIERNVKPNWKHSHKCWKDHSSTGNKDIQSSSSGSESEGSSSSGAEEEEDESKQDKNIEDELSFKLNNPYRMHEDIWYNETKELNDGPVCKCSLKSQKFGIRHDIYPGEEPIPMCDLNSNNLDKLYHYKIIISPTTNFQTKHPTVIMFDKHEYTFEGFSLFTHHEIPKLPDCQVIRFNIVYTIHMVEEPIPENFSIRSLDLLTRYFFDEILELVDIDWKGYRAEDDHCRRFHLMPRFARPFPENGKELLSMNDIMLYLLKISKPLILKQELPELLQLDKSEWDKFVDSFRHVIVTCPGMRPSAIRIDQLDREECEKGKRMELHYPMIVHHGVRPAQLSYAGDPVYKKTHRAYLKFRHILCTREKVTEKDKEKLDEFECKLEKIRTEYSKKREVTSAISSENFIITGVRADICQHAMMLPVLFGHLRFHNCLQDLERRIKYQFVDKTLLQLALTHSSYKINYGTNIDHGRNSLSNCGFRQLQFGDSNIHIQHTRKRGLNMLLRIMARLGRKEEAKSDIPHNERLEFLGDAVVEYITSTHLYQMLPRAAEGELTIYRGSLVQNNHLAVLADKLRLQDYLLYAHGTDLCHDSTLKHAMANCMEALMGALFLDGGIELADRVFSETLFGEEPDLLDIWYDSPPHPLIQEEPDGDRHWIEKSTILQNLTKFEEDTGYEFKYIRLLARALTMRHVGFNNLTLGHNQRLEFLGDSVMQLITSDYLYRHFPDHHEGHLTLLRSSLVSNRTQAMVADEIGLPTYLVKAQKSKATASGAQKSGQEEVGGTENSVNTADTKDKNIADAQDSNAAEAQNSNLADVHNSNAADAQNSNAADVQNSNAVEVTANTNVETAKTENNVIETEANIDANIKEMSDGKLEEGKQDKSVKGAQADEIVVDPEHDQNDAEPEVKMDVADASSDDIVKDTDPNETVAEEQQDKALVDAASEESDLDMVTEKTDENLKESPSGEALTEATSDKIDVESAQVESEVERQQNGEGSETQEAHIEIGEDQKSTANVGEQLDNQSASNEEENKMVTDAIEQNVDSKCGDQEAVKIDEAEVQPDQTDAEPQSEKNKTEPDSNKTDAGSEPQATKEDGEQSENVTESQPGAMEKYQSQPEHDRPPNLKLKEKADLLEALLGAMFVDSGLEPVKVMCEVCFFPRLQSFIMNQDWNDPKSHLQQCCLTMRAVDDDSPDIPIYKVLQKCGPTNLRRYKVAVYFREKRLAVGEGGSIQQAEMSAAENALKSPDLIKHNTAGGKKNQMKIAALKMYQMGVAGHSTNNSPARQGGFHKSPHGKQPFQQAHSKKQGFPGFMKPGFPGFMKRPGFAGPGRQPGFHGAGWGQGAGFSKPQFSKQLVRRPVKRLQKPPFKVDTE